MKVENVPGTLDVTFRVVDTAGKQIQYWVRPAQSGVAEKVVDLPEAGAYYIEVRDGGDNARSSEPYTLTASFSPSGG